MDRDAKVPVLRRAEEVGFFGRRSRTAPPLPAVRLTIILLAPMACWLLPHAALRAMRSTRSAISSLVIRPPHTQENSASSSL